MNGNFFHKQLIHHFCWKLIFFFHIAIFISFQTINTPKANVLSIINPIYSNIFQLKIANSGYHFFEMVEYPICKFDSFPCIGNGGFYDFLDGKNPKSSCNLRWILVFDIFNSFLDVLVNTFFFQFNRCFTF